MARNNLRARNGFNYDFDDDDDYYGSKPKSKLDKINDTLKNNDAVIPALIETITLLKSFKKERLNRNSTPQNDNHSKEFLRLKEKEISQNRDLIKKIEKVSLNFNKTLDKQGGRVLYLQQQGGRGVSPHNVHSTLYKINKESRKNQERESIYREINNSSHKERITKERKVNEKKRENQERLSRDRLINDLNDHDPRYRSRSPLTHSQFRSHPFLFDFDTSTSRSQTPTTITDTSSLATRNMHGGRDTQRQGGGVLHPSRPATSSTPLHDSNGNKPSLLKRAYYYFLKDKQDYEAMQRRGGNRSQHPANRLRQSQYDMAMFDEDDFDYPATRNTTPALYNTRALTTAGGLNPAPVSSQYLYGNVNMQGLDSFSTSLDPFDVELHTEQKDKGGLRSTQQPQANGAISAPAPLALTQPNTNPLTIKTERVELVTQQPQANGAISAPAPLALTQQLMPDFNANAISAERYEQEQEKNAQIKSQQDHINVRERLTDEYREEHLRKLDKLIAIVSTQKSDVSSTDDPSMLDTMLDMMNPFSKKTPNVKKPSFLKRTAQTALNVGKKALPLVSTGTQAIAKGGGALVKGALNIGAKGAGALGAGLQAGLSAYNYLTAENTQDRKTAVGEGVGGAVGAVLGSFIPVPIVGSLLGGWVGSKVGGLVSSWLTKPEDMIPDDIKKRGKRAELEWINDNVPVLYENKQISQKDVKGFYKYKDTLMQDLAKEQESLNTYTALNTDNLALQPAYATQSLEPHNVSSDNTYPHLESIDKNEVYNSTANLATHNISNITNNVMQMQPYRLSDKDTLFLMQYGY